MKDIKMNNEEITKLRCGCVIEFINGKHLITQYCPEHEEDDEEYTHESKSNKIKKFHDSESI